MTERAPIFDTWVRGDLLPDSDLANLAYFGVRAALFTTHDRFVGEEAADLGRHHARVMAQVERAREHGIQAVYALSVPPGKIPWLGLDALLANLPASLDSADAAAIGVVGLSAGGEREEDVLSRQIAQAVSLRLPLVVSLPLRDRPKHLRRTLSLLREGEVPPEGALFVGPDLESIPVIRALGYRCALGALSAEDAAALVARVGPEGFVLGSGAGGEPWDPVRSERTLALMEAAGLSAAVRRRVAWETAASLLDISGARGPAVGGP